MKRGRNQRRRQGQNPNRALDSNGPDVRIRGTANQIHEKYLNLARDASSSGDRVKAENYFQHAEHYFRLIKSQQPPQQQQTEQSNVDSAGEQPSLGNDRNSDRDNDRDSNRNEGRGRNRSRGDARLKSGAEGPGLEGAEEGDKENALENTVEAANDGASEESAERKQAANGADTDQAIDADAEKKPRRRRPRRPAKTDDSGDDPKPKSVSEKADA